MAAHSLPSSEIEVQPFDRQVDIFDKIVSAIEPAR
jgi:hypothetical protein